jgi:RNA-binding protein
MPLTGQASRKLRAMAHELKPVVQVGKQGATETVGAAVARALLDHELIKVKVLSEAPESPDDTATTLAELTSSDVVQRIGRVIVLYKPHPKKQKIEIPKGYTAPPKRAKSAPRDEPEDAEDDASEDE